MTHPQRIKPFKIFMIIIISTIILYYLYLEYNINYVEQSIDYSDYIDLSNLTTNEFNSLIVSIIDKDKDESLIKKQKQLRDGIGTAIFSSMVVCIINGEYHSPALILSAIVNNTTTLLTKVFF